ncbi:methylaspartate mutase accessory protein GlmL [Dendrosporobacter sp. 1207_IL3150]|uniref:methylaspartate mutase accessory protein GlmL n=1 Tax=Dendrosporobacter sp. 1207_IL3150 TaxID=3084054 RepID=UPI002FD9B97D
MNNVLLIDFGSTYTKITAVDVEQEIIIGTARGITTVETDITEGLNKALKELFLQTGKLEFSKILGCSSAAGGLKMVAIGLVPELTAEAAKRAALGAGAKVLKVFGHELSEYEITEIAELNPDIILLAGGTDGGNKQVILHNAQMLKNLGKDVPIVVAGNKSVTPTVVKILSETMTQVVPCANVMPKLNELNIESAREVIRDIFLQRIIEAKGINKANKMVDRMVMPTPAAVLKAAELLSIGTNKESGIGDLMVVDIGGATTDVYSIAKGDPTTNAVLRGLPEPFSKRTVEGDLGMRYSASPLLKAAGAELIAKFANADESEVAEYVEKVTADIEYLPQNVQDKGMEVAMGRACTKLGADRHVGQLETHYSVLGQVFVQTGKDLTNVNNVIGTGGVIISNERPNDILKGIIFEDASPHVLKPKKPEFAVDKDYIMASMGLLGEDYPELAIRMMKKYIVRR